MCSYRSRAGGSRAGGHQAVAALAIIGVGTQVICEISSSAYLAISPAATGCRAMARAG